MERGKERMFDAWLVASARVGDRDALATLVTRWNGKLLAHAWRLLRDREGAKDAVQDGWAKRRTGTAAWLAAEPASLAPTSLSGRALRKTARHSAV
jgi:DNA-directed RNA polymerase specialized sigma24 family protein